ncbi:MAG TPA: hypothetical protein VEZ17_00475 [Chitinophagaceae bacterium]|nr:hypothetical protein [Chitinophagaceae bacterium]
MKKILFALTIIIAIAAGVFFYLKSTKLKDFEPQIKERLNKLVSEASNGLYRLEIGELHTDVIGSKITLTNAHLVPDTLKYVELQKQQLAPNDLFDVYIKHLSIDDIVAADFIGSKSINLRRLFINEPVIRVWHKKQPYKVPDSVAAKTIYQQIRNDISSIKVDTIILENIDFIYTNKNKKSKETRLLNIKLYLADLLIDSSTQNDQERFLFAKNCLINLKKYTTTTSDGLYRFTLGDLDIETQQKAMRLKNIQFTPVGTVRNFYKQIGHQQDRFELSLAQVDFSNIEWWTLLAEESLVMNKAQMQNGKIKIFNDKSQPADTRSKVGKYPHQLLMKVPFLIKVDTIGLNNFDLSYTELNPKSGQTGTINFENINGTITNITNDPGTIKQNKFLSVSAKASFMKRSAVTAGFKFDLAQADKGAFTVTAQMGAVPYQALNEITVPLALLKINRLNLKSLDVSMRGDNYRASGTVKMIYDDLNITALKAADDTLKKRGLLSFIANNFVIKSKNPAEGQAVRIEKAAYERDTQRSFFNLVWKTIFTGSGKTVEYNKK